MILGITGGTGCGKTTLLSCIAQYGGVIFDCDAIYHELLRTDKGMLSAIDAAFPGCVKDGILQRKKLGALVFSDPEALLTLNSITHRAVKAEILRRLEEKPALAAIDAIGLFEGELAELCDITVAVTAPEDARVARLMARDGISEDYARARIKAQHEKQWFVQRCDFCLQNDGTHEEFQEKCLAFLHRQGIILPETINTEDICNEC